jgi:peptidoglycan/xylan/chitin deacetylase (PgdA/CDA1 family)
MAYKKFFTLSFDDGIEHDKRLIALMKQYGLSGTFNLNAGLFGECHKLVNINRIPKDEIRQVYEGFEVASHGYKHEMFRYMSRKKIEMSLSTDIRELSEIMGYQVVGHAYPYDMHTRAAEDFLRNQNMLYARKVMGKGSLFRFPENPHKYIATCWFNAKNVMELLDQFIKAEAENENLLFMMWGHSYEMEKGFRPCPEPQLERIFSKIAGKPDIVYCTNREAFERNKEKVHSS